MERSVRKLGDAVRIIAQLVSANDGAHVWAERFDQAPRNPQDRQDSTGQCIASALDVKFQAALGYTNVYWYRGGWEAWDAHDLPKAPLDLPLMPR